MTWQDLANKGTVRPHAASLTELSDLRAVIERDLKDAEITVLSADRRFAIAYNVVLQLKEAQAFRTTVEEWIAKNHPALSGP